jgi:hypothetical protein
VSQNPGILRIPARYLLQSAFENFDAPLEFNQNYCLPQNLLPLTKNHVQLIDVQWRQGPRPDSWTVLNLKPFPLWSKL